MRKRKALATVAPFIRRETTSVSDALAFLKALGMGGSMGVANASWARRVTFNELNTTGSLRLIEDADLRARIVSYQEINYAMFVNLMVQTFSAQTNDLLKRVRTELKRLG